MTNIIIPSGSDETVTSNERCSIHFYRTYWSTDYHQNKVVINLPHPDEDSEYAECIKELSFNDTHRRFNPAADDWTMDLEGLNDALHLCYEHGIDVSVDVDVARKFEEEFGTFLPELRV